MGCYLIRLEAGEGALVSQSNELLASTRPAVSLLNIGLYLRGIWVAGIDIGQSFGRTRKGIACFLGRDLGRDAARHGAVFYLLAGVA